MNSKKIANLFIKKQPKHIADLIIHKFSQITYGQDVSPYLRFFENVFSVKEKGLKLSKKIVSNWDGIFYKSEVLLSLVENKLQIYPLIILKETLAHRYADYYRFTGKHENKFNEYYEFSRKNSKINNYGLHIDGGAFWNGVAYERCNEIEKAATFFNMVVQNRLTFVDVRMPVLKVQSSFDFFIKNKEYVPQNIGQCVQKLEEQNCKYGDFLGTSLPVPQRKIDAYKTKWPVDEKIPRSYKTAS